LLLILSDLVEVSEACEGAREAAANMLAELVVALRAEVGPSICELLDEIPVDFRLHGATLCPTDQPVLGLR